MLGLTERYFGINRIPTLVKAGALAVGTTIVLSGCGAEIKPTQTINPNITPAQTSIASPSNETSTNSSNNNNVAAAVISTMIVVIAGASSSTYVALHNKDRR